MRDVSNVERTLGLAARRLAQFGFITVITSSSWVRGQAEQRNCTATAVTKVMVKATVVVAISQQPE